MMDCASRNGFLRKRPHTSRFHSSFICKKKQPTPSGVPLLKQAPNNRWWFQTHLKEHISQIGLSIQQNYNTPVEHTPGNPPSPLWKESLYSLLVKVSGRVPKVCWNNLRGSYFKEGSKLRNLWPGWCEPPSPTVAPFAWHTYNEKWPFFVRLIRQDDRFQKAGKILHKRGFHVVKTNEVLGCPRKLVNG